NRKERSADYTWHTILVVLASLSTSVFILLPIARQLTYHGCCSRKFSCIASSPPLFQTLRHRVVRCSEKPKMARNEVHACGLFGLARHAGQWVARIPWHGSSLLQRTPCSLCFRRTSGNGL